MFNDGVVNVNGGTLTLSGSVSQFSGNKLTGGTWNVSANSTLNASAAANLTVNQGSVSLNGAGSNFPKINLLGRNEGNFTVAGGRTFTTSGDLVNTGTLTIGSGSTLTISGIFTNVGTVNGTTSPAPGLLQAGGGLAPRSGPAAGVLALGDAASNAGSLMLSGGIIASGSLYNTGSVVIDGPQSWAVDSAYNTDDGTTTLQSDAGAGGQNLTMNAAAPVTFNSTQHLAQLHVAGNTPVVMSANGNRTLYTRELTIGDAGSLDLNDNDLVVEYGTGASAFSDIRGLILAGFSNPSGGGIISTVGQNNPGGNTIHYVLDNALVGLSEWPLGSGNSIDANSVIARYTYFGDVNFDGKVDDSDYAVLDGNYGTTPLPGIAVLSGDANLSGTVDDSDYAVLDGNYGNGVGNALSPASLESVPEPSALALIGAGCMLLRRLRTRRS
jgi:hypothetical protein